MWYEYIFAAAIFCWCWLFDKDRLIQVDFISEAIHPKPFQVFVDPYNRKIKYLISNYYLITKL